jgi:hypothetical protein
MHYSIEDISTQDAAIAATAHMTKKSFQDILQQETSASKVDLSDCAQSPEIGFLPPQHTQL